MEPPSGVEIVRVAAADPLMADVAELCYECLHRPFGVPRDDDWNNSDPASSHLVALAGDRVVGYVRLIVEGRWGHIRQLSVAPGWRRRGVGSALVARAVADAAEAGVRGVYLNARMSAVGLYERVGFVRTGEQFPMPRTYLPHMRMELTIRPLRPPDDPSH